MDFFGIGSALQSMVRVYSFSSRQSGRTTSLIESVKDGDRICFADSKEALRVKKLLAEKEVKAECIVIHPREAYRIFERDTSEGRTIFDHSWVEQFYMEGIDNLSRALDKFERESSGFGEPHRETQRQAREHSKWRF